MQHISRNTQCATDLILLPILTNLSTYVRGPDWKLSHKQTYRPVSANYLPLCNSESRKVQGL